MSLEFNEIGIRMHNTSEGDSAGESEGSSAVGGGEQSEQAPAGIVKTCVRRVLQYLKTVQNR